MTTRANDKNNEREENSQTTRWWECENGTTMDFIVEQFRMIHTITDEGENEEAKIGVGEEVDRD